MKLWPFSKPKETQSEKGASGKPQGNLSNMFQQPAGNAMPEMPETEVMLQDQHFDPQTAGLDDTPETGLVQSPEEMEASMEPEAVFTPTPAPEATPVEAAPVMETAQTGQPALTPNEAVPAPPPQAETPPLQEETPAPPKQKESPASAWEFDAGEIDLGDIKAAARENASKSQSAPEAIRFQGPDQAAGFETPATEKNDHAASGKDGNDLNQFMTDHSLSFIATNEAPKAELIGNDTQPDTSLQPAAAADTLMSADAGDGFMTGDTFAPPLQGDDFLAPPADLESSNGFSPAGFLNTEPDDAPEEAPRQETENISWDAADMADDLLAPPTGNTAPHDEPAAYESGVSTLELGPVNVDPSAQNPPANIMATDLMDFMAPQAHQATQPSAVPAADGPVNVTLMGQAPSQAQDHANPLFQAAPEVLAPEPGSAGASLPMPEPAESEPAEAASSEPADAPSLFEPELPPFEEDFAEDGFSDLVTPGYADPEFAESNFIEPEEAAAGMVILEDEDVYHEEAVYPIDEPTAYDAGYAADGGDEADAYELSSPADDAAPEHCEEPIRPEPQEPEPEPAVAGNGWSDGPEPVIEPEPEAVYQEEPAVIQPEAEPVYDAAPEPQPVYRQPDRHQAAIAHHFGTDQFSRQVLYEEHRFTTNSLNTLVERYFSQSEPLESGEA